MKKYNNYVKCLTVLSNADRKKSLIDEIYRTGIIGQFNLNAREIPHFYKWRA